MERDLARELRYHIHRRVDDMMKDGLSETEARWQASIEFGGVAQVQEEVRDTWIWRWLDALVHDVRYSIRSLAKQWGFTLGAGAPTVCTSRPDSLPSSVRGLSADLQILVRSVKY